MNWTRQFIPTLREVPQEAEIESHKFLLRAGLIRKLAAGLYTLLPLGRRALRKVEGIIRDEMDASGSLEVLMPALHPKEIWERTGRYEDLRDVMFTIQDRQEKPLVLGPTHEEIVTLLVQKELRSYRDLPKNFYQIQTKYRDEIRPRFGLMRSKEFIMKDAYSFDQDEVSAQQSYSLMYNAYERIFRRCGLRTKVVEADTGAMGGSRSHEFMVLADSGEDGLVECDSCDYAANLEQAESHPREEEPSSNRLRGEELAEVATPGKSSVHDVSKFLGVTPEHLMKTLIYVVDDRCIAAITAGNQEVNEIKLGKGLKASHLRLADDAEIREVTGAPVGFAGPVGLSIPIYIDKKLRGASGMVCGGNKADTHLLNVELARDVSEGTFLDLSFAQDGEGCPRCPMGRLIGRRGIEVGHVFSLGNKYTEALGATFLTAEGKERSAIMGCYGIGVTRTLQAIVEQSHDRHGIIWPVSVAPYEVALLPLNMDHDACSRVTAELRDALVHRKIEVLVDDRDERPGVKFKDADLLGLPIRLTVGARSLENGEIEVKLRGDDKVKKVPVSAAIEEVEQAIALLYKDLA